MGLEASTYIDGLTVTWPLAGDNKSVGDDHLRLIKSVLKATFPNATKSFRFPTTEAISGTLTLDATDQNNIVLVDTTAGNITVNLPSGFTTTEKGWSCEVIKTSSDANAAIVAPASGTISSKSGSTATIRVGIVAEPARFIWSGSAWICSKHGEPIGSVLSYDGSALPHGYLAMAGSTYSSTDFAELFAVLATSTLRDRRGRMDVNEGTGTGLTARVSGTNYGAESVALLTANLPAYTPTGSISNGAITISGGTNGRVVAGDNNNNGGGGGTFSAMSSTPLSLTASQAASSFTGTAQGGSSTAVAILSPVIGTKKIIRAC